LIGCSKGRRARDRNPLQPALSRRAAAQVCEVMHSQVCGDFAQALSIGGKESAEQAASLEFLEPGLPGFRACAETFEDPSQLGRDHGFAIAEEPAGVIDQEQVVSQRESAQHPLTRRIQLAAVFDGAEPD
jgi:hypothetical protein